MSRRVTTVLALAFLLLVPTAGWCQLADYNQDFEELPLNAPNALSGDGWMVWENVYDDLGNLVYGQGYTAPNGGESFCALVTEQGGEEQGLQQLSVYNNYLNTYHQQAGYEIEVNVYQEQEIGAEDANLWLFNFDYKKGNIAGSSTAQAFIKVIDPASGYTATLELYYPINPGDDLWYGGSLEVEIPGDWVGQILQFGFMNTASNWEGSGIFYDNVQVFRNPVTNLDIFPTECPNDVPKKPTADLEAALLGAKDELGNWLFDPYDVDWDTLLLEGVSPFVTGTNDVAGPYVGPLCGCTTAGPDGVDDLVMVFDSAAVVAAVGVKKPGEYIVTLTGQMNDGTPFRFQDCIEIPSPKPEK
jgi:hypothetical protein